MSAYAQQIKSLNNLSFESIRSVAWGQISHLPEQDRTNFYNQLHRGVALLETNEQMCQYLWSFGNMHRAKLFEAFSQLPIEIFRHPFELVDWGCGQALGTVNLFDFIKLEELKLNVKKVTLVEPSKVAIERAKLHASAYVNIPVLTINDYFENINSEQIKSETGIPVIHIFSNILDVAQIDLKHLANLIDLSIVSDNYMVCVGPLNPTNQRIDAFYNYFNVPLLYAHEETRFKDRNWTFKCKLYQLEYNKTGHLIPIEYYPTVQFQAAYELDSIKSARKKIAGKYLDKYTHFEVAAPFDLGASIYDDVHPVFAVLNNLITRGLPTKTSLYLEEQISNCFKCTSREVKYGEISFKASEEIDYNKLVALFHTSLDNNTSFTENDAINLQLLLTPIAIARFQKVLIEALITGHLPLEKDNWKIIVEEGDVPFASLALNDFSQLFYNLTQLSKDFCYLQLPKIELHIISNDNFHKSPLHLDNNVHLKVPKSLQEIDFDLVVSLSILKSVSSNIESFSKFKCINNCYFNIRTISSRKTERVIYTSSLIKYKNLIERDTQGVYVEKEDKKLFLTYFLHLLFRKENFRPGQLPILDRALQNLPVIGLLPTGGGKSLTYQIAALLQPGVAMVIDPLKSLMKDQYDGLINSGIDCCAYINSTLSSKEKKEKEKQLESSQLLFVFLSPERLSIANFRERLRNMHEYNVYFSYGVIDEVHCVSEWGHDFRFSYLHLGRNLYNYVRAKEGVISLFGLTATASFDVLADVERELSGNGAFSLDTDVIVRYENTNRLELQYKIEKVSVEFEVDTYYDKNGSMPSHLPKAVNITNHWPLFNSKGKFLENYLRKVPSYINELQKIENINLIKNSFNTRQNISETIVGDFKIEIPTDFFVKNETYEHAGIVFCPHVNNTGLSVKVNSERLKESLISDVGSFTGSDNDESSMKNMESFRDNDLPLMVATKAFGMGIDKPNVRFTVNMNYSSSLEAFVQEAGRSGRDRKIALASILLSDYKLVKINSSLKDNSFPLSIIRNKWFLDRDFNQILNHFNLVIPVEHLLYATPSSDVVKLHCSKDNKMFAFNECSTACNAFIGCTLRKVTPETKGWKTENELIQGLRSQKISLSKKNFQYLNADYQNVMYFFNESFKGDIVEKSYMNRLLSKLEVRISCEALNSVTTIKIGFLSSLLEANINESIIVNIPYSDEDYTDLSKAIYRMCCIELIEDFTQDYSKGEFRIVAVRKAKGEYYNGLLRFMLRYFTLERAKIELEKVNRIELKGNQHHEKAEEIYKCLAYLTEFVYDKISEKRKRAIDDMRSFCLEGLKEDKTWVELNEDLKDYIYYYFNSKYAKLDYFADTGESFSLVRDTEGGKISDSSIIFKYLRVVDDEIVGVGTPLDNVKHLYGAVRLISRSLTDSNPSLALLEAFCIVYLGIKNNDNLKKQLDLRYSEGMIEMSNREEVQSDFWDIFKKFNSVVSEHLSIEQFKTLEEETSFLIHSFHFNKTISKYLEFYE
jgi:superfamily II DNA helicase RecQ